MLARPAQARVLRPIFGLARTSRRMVVVVVVIVVDGGHERALVAVLRQDGVGLGGNCLLWFMIASAEADSTSH
jgi:hypothetical protein